MKKTIAFVTDLHLNETLPVPVDHQKNAERVLADIAFRKVDEVIIGGDIGHSSAYAAFIEALEKLGMNFYIIPGNHDSVPDLLLHFPNPENASLAELYYSVEDGNFLYLFLDSSSDAISETQLNWLKQKIEATNTKVLLFIHHPIFEIDTPVDRKYPLQNRDQLQQLLLRQQREFFVFCGHYHTQDETGTGSISQYETPAVSYQIRKGTAEVSPHADYFGYRLLTLDTGNVKTEVVRFEQ